MMTFFVLENWDCIEWNLDDDGMKGFPGGAVIKNSAWSITQPLKRIHLNQF